MLKLVIIADDLTGANDAGVQFAKYGMKVQVLLGDSEKDNTGETVDVLVVDTDSRALPADLARSRVEAASVSLRNAYWKQSQPLIFKKIDSTLRGNLGPEIDAVLSVFGFEWAAVIPAFPANRRITAGGWHFLNQVPIAESEIAQDPKTPVLESVLPELLAKQSSYRVGHIHLTEVILGPNAIQERITQMLFDGVKLISFDATTEAHLRSIAKAIAGYRTRALWVGSAGMAEMIPAVMAWPEKKIVPQSPDKSGPVLIIAGSVSNVTRKQIQYLLAQEPVQLVSLSAEHLMQDETAEIGRCIREALLGLTQGRDVIIASAVEPDAIYPARSEGLQKGMDPHQVSESVARSLGKVVRELVVFRPAGIFLTGGDTAVAVCRALGVSAIEILDEVSTGIPLGKLSGGICPGLLVVTKAGAFGTEKSIFDAVNVLKGR